jgi:chitinase
VTNPGFETGTLSGWTCDAGDTVVNSPVHSGTHALQLTPTNSTTGQCTQTISVQANHTYILKAYVQGNYVYLGANGLNSTWTNSSGYTQLSTTFTTGASTTSVTIFVHDWYGQSNAYVDDVSLS